MKIFKNIDKNIEYIEKKFENSGDLVSRVITMGEKEKQKIYIVYVDMLTNVESIDENIVRSFTINQEMFFEKNGDFKKDIFEIIKEKGIQKVDFNEKYNLDEFTESILTGDTGIFVDGYEKALLVSTKKFPNRGISTPDSEVVIQGSKEAFSEVFRFNTALIRRRIRDTDLKIRQFRVGRRSKTDMAVIYIDGIVREKILNDVINRIENIDIDAIQDIGYIEQLIEDDFASPFPQAQITERPDKTTSSLLEGRIAIIVDNSPYALLIPSTLNTFFQASDDYYQRWQIMSFIRVLRFIAGIIAVCLPGLYIATTLYHPSMLPMELVFKMAEARKSVPFPAVLEIILMELIYELLREAGVRLPGTVGTTIGIVGGLIIGQSAVEAGIVSPIVVIVIAMTGIAGFAIPNYSLVTALRLTKFFILILSATLGLLGFWVAVIVVLIHLVSLKSYGIPYLFPYVSGDINNYTDFKDTIFRIPIFKMKDRPIFAKPDKSVRINKKSLGNKRKKE